MKFILGSGITGLLARLILGDDWTVVPFYKSRFYSYNPPLCDNFIIPNAPFDSIFTQLNLPIFVTMYKRAYDVGGQIMTAGEGLADAWLDKLFDGHPPSQAVPYMAARNSFFVYEKVRLNRLYEQLLNRFQAELLEQANLGLPTAITDHTLVRGKVHQPYTHMVSTIPLQQLLQLLGLQLPLTHKTLHYIHMYSKHVDLEGASQLLVVDPRIDFFKITALAKDRYLFYCHQDIRDPGSYFSYWIEDFDLLGGTMIKDALITGEIPDLNWLDAHNIFPIGAYAQHDFCADVGSNILRVLRYAERNYTQRTSLITVAG